MSAEPPAEGRIDHFTSFRQTAYLTGWCFSSVSPVVALELRPLGTARTYRFKPEWLPSPDVAAAAGPGAARCRFDVAMAIGPAVHHLCGGRLAAVLEDGQTIEICGLGEAHASAASDLDARFFSSLAELAAPRVLEIGSRTRSGHTRRGRLPPDATYTGVDIVDGDNVDIVCDVHELSVHVPRNGFDAVFAVSVLEHLIMPWKFIIELNHVLAPGAVGFFATHQCWPMHEQPWDFWRFSDRAWAALLNRHTGFEILGAAMAEPAFIVPRDRHAATNFGGPPQGFLASNVLFRKIGDTRLRWNVPASGVVEATYPR